MSHINWGVGALVLQVVAGQLLVAYLIVAIVGLALKRDLDHARRVVCEGILAALGFMVPATVLRTLVVRNWEEIGALAALLGLRIVLKKFFVWDRSQLISANPVSSPDRVRK
ncbi:MAG TPA: DUF1622 domain-containing protein [Vicinamibacteria bacterium]|nr:DUF1622 domain-containing protein [Vicinamibacteria bacterium]